MRTAMTGIEDGTCVRFFRRTNEADFIDIRKIETGCFGELGRVGGVQKLNLNDGCEEEIVKIQHELMHALGFGKVANEFKIKNNSLESTFQVTCTKFTVKNTS